MHHNSTGVILLNMGGPEKLADVRPFLYNLFSDRGIIRLGPSWLQRPLARLIAHRRAPKSEALYARIGGGSPLRQISQQQAEALAQVLTKEGPYHVRVAMRYWQPSADEAVRELLRLGVSRIIAVPLYPHYSRATSGSSLVDLRRAMAELAPSLPLVEVSSWPDHPLYIQALAAGIDSTIGAFSGQAFELVYSAHSLPKSFVDAGDPYVDELKKTISALEQTLGFSGRLCYQSRSGPVEWLAPSTSETIKELTSSGCRNLLVVPISFVSDHIETLYEIGMMFKDEAAAQGACLLASPSLNTNPTFISCLADLVLTASN